MYPAYAIGGGLKYQRKRNKTDHSDNSTNVETSRGDLQSAAATLSPLQQSMTGTCPTEAPKAPTKATPSTTNMISLSPSFLQTTAEDSSLYDRFAYFSKMMEEKKRQMKKREAKNLYYEEVQKKRRRETEAQVLRPFFDKTRTESLSAREVATTTTTTTIIGATKAMLSSFAKEIKEGKVNSEEFSRRLSLLGQADKRPEETKKGEGKIGRREDTAHDIEIQAERQQKQQLYFGEPSVTDKLRYETRASAKTRDAKPYCPAVQYKAGSTGAMTCAAADVPPMLPLGRTSSPPPVCGSQGEIQTPVSAMLHFGLDTISGRTEGLGTRTAHRARPRELGDQRRRSEHSLAKQQREQFRQQPATSLQDALAFIHAYPGGQLLNFGTTEQHCPHHKGATTQKWQQKKNTVQRYTLKLGGGMVAHLDVHQFVRLYSETRWYVNPVNENALEPDNVSRVLSNGLASPDAPTFALDELSLSVFVAAFQGAQSKGNIAVADHFYKLAVRNLSCILKGSMNVVLVLHGMAWYANWVKGEKGTAKSYLKMSQELCQAIGAQNSRLYAKVLLMELMPQKKEETKAINIFKVSSMMQNIAHAYNASEVIQKEVQRYTSTRAAAKYIVDTLILLFCGIMARFYTLRDPDTRIQGLNACLSSLNEYMGIIRKYRTLLPSLLVKSMSGSAVVLRLQILEALGVPLEAHRMARHYVDYFAQKRMLVHDTSALDMVVLNTLIRNGDTRYIFKMVRVVCSLHVVIFPDSFSPLIKAGSEALARMQVDAPSSLASTADIAADSATSVSGSSVEAVVTKQSTPPGRTSRVGKRKREEGGKRVKSTENDAAEERQKKKEQNKGRRRRRRRRSGATGNNEVAVNNASCSGALQASSSSTYTGRRTAPEEITHETTVASPFTQMKEAIESASSSSPLPSPATSRSYSVRNNKDGTDRENIDKEDRGKEDRKCKQNQSSYNQHYSSERHRRQSPETRSFFPTRTFSSKEEPTVPPLPLPELMSLTPKPWSSPWPLPSTCLPSTLPSSVHAPKRGDNNNDSRGNYSGRVKIPAEQGNNEEEAKAHRVEAPMKREGEESSYTSTPISDGSSLLDYEPHYKHQSSSVADRIMPPELMEEKVTHASEQAVEQEEEGLLPALLDDDYSWWLSSDFYDEFCS